ncbi:MAG: hypothetical protein FD149_2666 [Rhodospirillaceae bacterium]|nr:MAG: hypothetical protein FD149_2666 [Rhodospirillaceae bacterium]
MRVRLYANNDSWVQVSDGKAILLRRMLRKGDVYYVPNRSGLVLMVGNAGAVLVWVNGVMGPALGPAGHVRRNVPLDPDKIMSIPRTEENAGHQARPGMIK